MVAGIGLIAGILFILDCYAFFACRWPEAQFPWVFALTSLPLSLAYALLSPLADLPFRTRYRITATGLVCNGALLRWDRFRGFAVSPDASLLDIPRVLLYRQGSIFPLAIFLDQAVADAVLARLRERLPELAPAREILPDAGNPLSIGSARYATPISFLLGLFTIAGFTLLTFALEYFSFTHHGHATTSAAIVAWGIYWVLALAANCLLMKQRAFVYSRPLPYKMPPQAWAWLLGLLIGLLWLPWFFLLLRH
ncbi:MAG: hypothetical protein ACM359_07645 [Bacillota bacterium]